MTTATADPKFNPISETFSYDFSPISEIAVETHEHPKTGRPVVDKVIIKDEAYEPSDRFFVSLFARFGFNNAFFRYFNHAEVFERISQVENSDRIRICAEHTHDQHGQPVKRLLAVSNPKNPIVTSDDLMELLGRFNTDPGDIQYHAGIIDSTHNPRVGATNLSIAGDVFANQFIIATPIDGYGQPNVYLSLLRQVCTNGVIAYSRAFRSAVSIGKGDDNVAFSLTRVLDQFSNDEGYAALRSRIESAAKSWASVYETESLYKLLTKLLNAGGLEGSTEKVAQTPFMRDVLSRRLEGEDETSADMGTPTLRAFHKMTGDTSRLYGLANLDSLSAKRQRTLPVRCTVYDCINFATEVATHHSTTATGRRLNAWVGDLISGEYDMEGTKEKFGEFADFHLGAKLGAGLTGSEHIHN